MRIGKKAVIMALILALGLVAPMLASTGPALAGTWSLEATAGLGNAANGTACVSAMYNSRLYVGTENPAGLEVYSYDGETWLQEVGGGAGPAAPGFGDAANTAAASMAVYGSDLYVGTSNGATGCEVWRFDGAAWTQLVGGDPTALIGSGFGNPLNPSASAMAVYGGELLVGTFNWAGCEVWRFDGAAWTQSVGTTPAAVAGPGFGTACVVVRVMQVYGIDLYAGTGSPGGGEVWRFDGVAWVPLVSADPAAPMGTGFGNVANFDIKDMAAYGSFLYAGTTNGATGCEVWSFDGAAWTQLVGGDPAALIGSGFANIANQDAARLEVYDSRLYAGTCNYATGCEVWSFDGAAWTQEVGAGAAGTFEAPGFGDANNVVAWCSAVFNNRLYLGTQNAATGCDVFSLSSTTTWYLAEGATEGGFETWVLVQNPNAAPANVALTFQTGAGPVAGPNDVIPAKSRRSYLVNTYVGTFDVSTKVEADSDIICERSMYWTPQGSTVRRVGHDSIGVINPASTWYLAEGATEGGFETWVLIQNPNPNPVNVDVRFQTGAGDVQGPQETLDANSRKSYLVDNYVNTFDVSTRVESYMGDVVCERAVYFTPDGYAAREVGHDSIGAVSPSTSWYLAEGATAGGFETWVLVQNPNDIPVDIDIQYQTGAGPVPGPGEPPITDTIPAQTRRSYLVNNWVSSYDVSTRVTSIGGAVVCERAMYETPAGSIRMLGHDSIGTTVGGLEWFLPEGATAGGFETWVLVQNPNLTPVDIDVRFQTGAGEVPGPTDTIPALSRKSYRVNDYVSTFDVSTKVTSNAGGYIICERAVYWRPAAGAVRYLGTDSIGFCP